MITHFRVFVLAVHANGKVSLFPRYDQISCQLFIRTGENFLNLCLNVSVLPASLCRFRHSPIDSPLNFAFPSALKWFLWRKLRNWMKIWVSHRLRNKKVNFPSSSRFLPSKILVFTCKTATMYTEFKLNRPIENSTESHRHTYSSLAYPMIFEWIFIRALRKCHLKDAKIVYIRMDTNK